VSFIARTLSIIRRISIVIAIAIAFLFGVGSTVYLSLRSPEVTVPNVVGKDRFEAEKILADADLNFRVRATRPSNQAKPDTVLFQLPRPGEVVKAGQTVAMDISRTTKEGEAPETVKPPETVSENTNANASSTNENRPRRNRNQNANANSNTNINTNSNANANTVRPPVNRNSNSTIDNANSVPRPNVNAGEGRNSNSRPASNQNENRRPVTPRPTPTPNNRQNR
jgi:beta-lactam-binding protein with PASTA domain